MPVFLSTNNKIGQPAAQLNQDNVTICSQMGWGQGVWYIGVYGWCLPYTKHTSFLPYQGFEKSVACLPWYAEGELGPGTSFSLGISLKKPQCTNDSHSDITYTRN